jgi:MFS family permease
VSRREHLPGVIFLVGSILSGLSTSLIELVAFRAVQGMGAG